MDQVNNPDWFSFCPPAKKEEAEKFSKYMKQETVFNGPTVGVDCKGPSTTAVVAREFDTFAMIIEMEVGYNNKLGIWINKKQHIEYGDGLSNALA